MFEQSTLVADYLNAKRARRNAATVRWVMRTVFLAAFLSPFLCGGFYVMTMLSIVEVSAVYPGISLHGREGFFYDDWFDSVYIDPERRPPGLPPIFVELYGVRLPLDEITEAELKKLPRFERNIFDETEEPHDPTSNRRTGDVYYHDYATWLWFREGRLIDLHSRGGNLAFGSNREGPYYHLPLNRAQVREVFGKPTRFERERRWLGDAPFT